MAKWNLDVAHSNVDFSIKHMMFAKVNGSFNLFSADIEGDAADLTTASIAFSIDVASIDTRNEDRDNHLRSADFFDVENHPAMTFKATKIVKTDDGEYDVTGDLTLHGVTKSETIQVSFGGTGKDPWGQTKAGFSGTGKLKRSDYGLVWNAALETGGVLVGDEVKFTVDIQVIEA